MVPQNLNATLPAPLGNKVTDVKLAHHKYALRTLRQGYIYVFHEKHPRGSHIKWEVYSVSAAGTVWKQLSPEAMKPVVEEPACARNGHNIPASVITIESPEKCKRVWIAFSEHPWSKETFADFAKDAKLRDRRMQTFLPATWIAAGGYRHGLPATRANIEQVVEYKPDFNAEALNGTVVPKVSEENGTHKQRPLETTTTRYQAISRKGQSEPLAKTMQQISQDPKGKDHTPIMIALWDSVGIAHELNGFYNEAAGWVEKYNAERDLQVSAMMALEGLKNALSKKAADDTDEFQKRAIENSSYQGDTARRRANAAKLPPQQRAHELEICDIIDDWKRRKVPATLYMTQLNHANLLSEPGRSIEIDRVKQEANDMLARRDKAAVQNIENARENSWERYEDQLAGGPGGKKLYQDFKDKYDKFLGAATKLMNERATDVVAWLESRYLVNALTEFHGASSDDGIAYDTHVGMAIFGIQASEAGQKKLDDWIKELKTAEHNLLWRAVALNQTEAMAELDGYLTEAGKHAAQKTPAGSLDVLTTISKSLKAVVDTYKKVASFNSSNTDAASDKGSKAFGIKLNPINARGIDLVVMTAGDRIFGQFRIYGLADYASEKMIQHLFSIRALLTPGDSLKLLEAQVANGAAVRAQTLQMIRSAQGGSLSAATELKTKQAEALRKTWKEFNDTNAKAANSMRDARLALLIMLIEGVNFSKLLNDCLTKNDKKSWFSLAASGMTVTSALYDMASVPAKALAKGGGDSWSYQRLKLIGGTLSTLAAGLTAYIDVNEAEKKGAQGQRFVSMLYLAKAFIGGGGAALTFATTFTYSAPVIGRLLKAPAISSAARVAGGRAAAIIAARILFMSVGAWVTVLTFGLQVLIWIFSKDELQIWCARCPFGVDRNTEGHFKSAKEQTKAFEDVLIGMGMAPEKAAKGPTSEELAAQPRPSVEEMMMYD
ncbi:hypothetical protein GO485_14870 [Pseudoduganella flava]|uniref:Toxin VasX N-terminal region domain-containing protein n=1 Tax=Pseudoduganella flava TaxID=871742 RepID=A0ABX6FXV6_9BURK|nr:T6SS effector BTH_I2691 family protein [Pseudoduganella flava]QGZ40202.1 hypothetical protein GO485_14870 [Pseudoduganella flava]